jgi:hypothetical protein
MRLLIYEIIAALIVLCIITIKLKGMLVEATGNHLTAYLMITWVFTLTAFFYTRSVIRKKGKRYVLRAIESIEDSTEKIRILQEVMFDPFLPVVYRTAARRELKNYLLNSNASAAS